MSPEPHAPKSTACPAFFDASHAAIAAFRSNVEARPWLRGGAFDPHLLAEHFELALFLLMFHLRWRHAHGSVDVVDRPSDPRFGVWLTQLTRNLECWYGAVDLLLKDAHALGLGSTVVDEEFHLVGELLKVAGPGDCIDLVAFTASFRAYLLTTRLKAAERRALERRGAFARTTRLTESTEARSSCRGGDGRPDRSRKSHRAGSDAAGH